MPFPILTEFDLPVAGTSCERSDVDFKSSVAPQPSIECAKDVAALANTVGGAIIIGADTTGTTVTGYPGVAAATAAKLPNAYEQSVKDRCRPPPRIVSQLIARADKDPVVVVNVWPSPLAPVGVHVRQSTPGAKLVDEAWAFPIRVGSHTAFLQPDQFATLENVSARRAAALLLGIPSNEREQISLRWTRPNGNQGASTPYSSFDWAGVLEEVLPDKNVARFRIGPKRTDSLHPLHLSLDWIETVWRDERSNTWVVFSAAVIEANPAGGTNYRAIRV